eukprot:SM000039S14515  [mRNA]  locus=s39:536473:542886:- [translate_table: standard]
MGACAAPPAAIEPGIPMLSAKMTACLPSGWPACGDGGVKISEGGGDSSLLRRIVADSSNVPSDEDGDLFLSRSSMEALEVLGAPSNLKRIAVRCQNDFAVPSNRRRKGTPVKATDGISSLQPSVPPEPLKTREAAVVLPSTAEFDAAVACALSPGNTPDSRYPWQSLSPRKLPVPSSSQYFRCTSTPSAEALDQQAVKQLPGQLPGDIGGGKPRVEADDCQLCGSPQLLTLPESPKAVQPLTPRYNSLGTPQSASTGNGSWSTPRICPRIGPLYQIRRPRINSSGGTSHIDLNQEPDANGHSEWLSQNVNEGDQPGLRRQGPIMHIPEQEESQVQCKDTAPFQSTCQGMPEKGEADKYLKERKSLADKSSQSTALDVAPRKRRRGKCRGRGKYKRTRAGSPICGLREDIIFVPGRSPAPWSTDEMAAFKLGLYFFGKDFCAIKDFMETKGMSDLIHYYYGAFVHTPAHARWSTSKESHASLRRHACSGRLEELLQRLAASTSTTSLNLLRQVTLGHLICTLRREVGLELLISCVGIGSGRCDLTRSYKDPTKCQLAPLVVPDGLPSGPALRKLVVKEIVELLNGVRLSKARRQDLFWEAVWPRLLERGWRALQASGTKCSGLDMGASSRARKSAAYFLPPGKAGLSRGARKGVHYFDSLSDVLDFVAAKPAFLGRVDDSRPAKAQAQWAGEEATRSSRAGSRGKTTHCKEAGGKEDTVSSCARATAVTSWAGACTGPAEASGGSLKDMARRAARRKGAYTEEQGLATARFQDCLSSLPAEGVQNASSGDTRAHSQAQHTWAAASSHDHELPSRPAQGLGRGQNWRKGIRGSILLAARAAEGRGQTNESSSEPGPTVEREEEAVPAGHPDADEGAVLGAEEAAGRKYCGSVTRPTPLLVSVPQKLLGPHETGALDGPVRIDYRCVKRKRSSPLRSPSRGGLVPCSMGNPGVDRDAGGQSPCLELGRSASDCSPLSPSRRRRSAERRPQSLRWSSAKDDVLWPPSSCNELERPKLEETGSPVGEAATDNGVGLSSSDKLRLSDWNSSRSSLRKRKADVQGSAGGGYAPKLEVRAPGEAGIGNRGGRPKMVDTGKVEIAKGSSDGNEEDEESLNLPAKGHAQLKRSQPAGRSPEPWRRARSRLLPVVVTLPAVLCKAKSSHLSSVGMSMVSEDGASSHPQGSRVEAASIWDRADWSSRGGAELLVKLRPALPNSTYHLSLLKMGRKGLSLANSGAAGTTQKWVSGRTAEGRPEVEAGLPLLTGVQPVPAWKTNSCAELLCHLASPEVLKNYSFEYNRALNKLAFNLGGVGGGRMMQVLRAAESVCQPKEAV